MRSASQIPSASEYRFDAQRLQRRHDLLGGLALALLALLVFMALPMPAKAHDTDCSKTRGVDLLRCERHTKMAAQCGPLQGEAHFACDREFLLKNPLVCTALEGNELKRCEAESVAFKACESKPGQAFVRCLRDTLKANPMGPG